MLSLRYIILAPYSVEDHW